MSTIKTWQERIVGDNRTWAVEAGMKAEIAELRAALAASGGNAAPELPTLPQAGNATRSGVLVWYEAQMREYGKACAQSAPNAALVAALEALEEVGALEDGLLGDDPKIIKAQKMARAALSAAGQEVGK